MSKALSTQSAALPVVPDFLNTGDYVLAADSGMTAEDTLTPRLKLVQAMSAQAKGNKMAIGTYVNTLTGESEGEELKVFNLGFIRTWLVSDRVEGNSGSVFKVYSNEQRAEAEQFAADNGLKCTLSHRHFVMRADRDDLAVYAVDMSGSATSSSKAWNSLIISKFGNMPRQAPVYVLGVKEVENDKGSWYIPDITFSGGYVTSKQQLDWLITTAAGLDELKDQVKAPALLR
jgi:hypothetical protein